MVKLVGWISPCASFFFSPTSLFTGEISVKPNQSKDILVAGKALTIVRDFRKLQMTITRLLRMCLLHAVFVGNYFSKVQRCNPCIKILYYWEVGRWNVTAVAVFINYDRIWTYNNV